MKKRLVISLLFTISVCAGLQSQTFSLIPDVPPHGRRPAPGLRPATVNRCNHS